MSQTLSIRLTRLLDVLQQVHTVKRSVAARVIGETCGVSHRYITNLATNAVRVLGKRPERVDGAALSRMEARYHVQLDALITFETSCAQFAARLDLERVA